MSLAAFQDYLSLEKNYSVHTLKAYIRDIQAFETYCKAEFQLYEIADAEYNFIRSWIVQLVGDGLSNRTVNRKISSLIAYYKFLVKIEQIKINPLAKHKSLKTAKKVEIPFSEQEMIQILQQIEYPDDFEGS